MRLPISSKSLAFKIQQLAVLPLALALALFAAGALINHVMSAQEAEHEQNQLATRWLLTMSRHATSPDNREFLQTAFDDMLEMPHVSGIYLFNNSGELLIKQGKRPDINLSSSLSDSLKHWSDAGHNYYSVPIWRTGPRGVSIQDGWLVMSVNPAGVVIRQYQGAALILACLLAAFAVMMIMAWRLTRSVEVPIHNVQKTLQDFNRQNLESRVPVSGSVEMQTLAHNVNELGERLLHEQNNIRQQIDLATSELQETLDQVEIQSIELDLARKKAVQANKIKTEFLANTSHEIRTPINGILGFTNLLLKSPLTTQQREYLRTIAHSSQGLLTIINDILDFSRLEEDKLILDSTPFNLRQIIEETLQVLAPAASEKQLYLVALQGSDTPLNLIGDALRIKQVLTNLIGNAIKFTDHGHILITTELVDVHSNIAQIRVRVTDTGIGINHASKASLFEAFQQADGSDNRLRGGTGLGLAIAKKLVDKMGGSIDIDSNPETGACAWFSLPLPIQQNTFEPKYQSLLNRRAAVMVEIPILAQQLTTYLNQWGIKVVSFGSLQKLLRGAENDNFDWLIALPKRDTTVGELEPLLKMSQPKVIGTLPDSALAYNERVQEMEANLVFLPLSHDHLYQVLRDALHLPAGDSPLERVIDKSARVMVVDDNPANLQLVCTFLQAMGVQAVGAKSGMDALELLKHQKVDLIFMDVQMPGMDGLEASRRIRQAEPENQRIPIIALTAHDMGQQMAELRHAGMDDYTTKPISEQQLAHFIQHWLGKAPSIQPALAAPAAVNLAFPQSAIMDLQEALRLANGKSDLARDMLHNLTSKLGDDAETIVELYRQKDLQSLQDRVHRLYGGCCYCGVPELRQASGQLDNYLVNGYHEQLDDAVNAVVKAIQRLRSWADEHDLDTLFEVTPQAAP
ncbi:response regulator [Pseudomaricurvus sp. HS19]|uniref:response regulator n=1 Tax=Pseudomaricurvus sp. HS19 TaxID=2692626 RepID=UPI00136B1659|nr:response regulator [Pseudomaricurvus sp. HS19]